MRASYFTPVLVCSLLYSDRWILFVIIKTALCVFVCVCVCICSDRLPVVRVDYWPQSGEGAPLQDMKFVAVVFTAEVCGPLRDFPPPAVHIANDCVAWAQVGELANALFIYEKQCHLDINTQCWLTATYEDYRFPLSRVYPQRSSCAFFCKPPLKPPPFSVSSCRWKKPNVCLLSPVLTSSLPPLSPSAPPVYPVPVAEPAWTTLHTAVQRQPQRS